MSDVEKLLIALFTLAIVAVVLASKQTQNLITGASQLLVSFVNRVNGGAPAR